MKIALVDDIEFQLQTLKDAILSALGELGLEAEQIDAFTLPEAFLADFEKGKYDIIILDIYMGDANGIDVARQIRKTDTEVALAFCTSSNEFASETYEVAAKYYLNKPISQDKVVAMLKRFNLASIERNRSIKLPDGCRVPLQQILYTEYSNHSITVHIKDFPPRSFYMTQGEAETMLLAHKGFCVVNKGCIINFAQVKSVETNAIVMQNGTTVSVARRRFKEIENEYMKYRFDCMNAEVSD